MLCEHLGKKMSTNIAMTQRAAAEAVAEFLRNVVITDEPQTRAGYCHMGATLTDTVLQAGLNYRSVVLPRVSRILDLYPNAKTTTSFSAPLLRRRSQRITSMVSSRKDQSPHKARGGAAC